MRESRYRHSNRNQEKMLREGKIWQLSSYLQCGKEKLKARLLVFIIWININRNGNKIGNNC